MKTGNAFLQPLVSILSATACIFFFFSLTAHAAPLQPFTSPALISKPDYPDRFTAPFAEPADPALKTPFLLSRDGYIYSVDTRGVRIYTVPLSYGLPALPVMVPYFHVPVIPVLPQPLM
ncbi:hypothetical protein C8D99_104192 [Aminivibrio pyruvatiphilus]|jgi:hypothetical protein|uniref:Uncharacterized protein n=1 Tax=Aminivibrio pyruvatiphilus TaxID=1005740 RepID=A0A4R8MCK1_9BACT|nr:hypothetical protein C8D99_104192 [Aminivibrio pyruvatiphilus]